MVEDIAMAVIAVVVGLAFSFTPLPMLPILFLGALPAAFKDSAWFGACLFLGGFTFSCLPLIFIWSIYEKSPIAGILFAICLYSLTAFSFFGRAKEYFFGMKRQKTPD
jgi:hypothetical protein